MNALYWGLAIIVAVIIIALITRAVIRAHKPKPMTGEEATLNEEGEAITDINPKGQVLVRGEYWKAASKEPISKGESIRVVGNKGLVLIVEKLKKEE